MEFPPVARSFDGCPIARSFGDKTHTHQTQYDGSLAFSVWMWRPQQGPPSRGRRQGLAAVAGASFTCSLARLGGGDGRANPITPNPLTLPPCSGGDYWGEGGFLPVVGGKAWPWTRLWRKRGGVIHVVGGRGGGGRRANPITPTPLLPPCSGGNGTTPCNASKPCPDLIGNPPPPFLRVVEKDSGSGGVGAWGLMVCRGGHAEGGYCAGTASDTYDLQAVA